MRWPTSRIGVSKHDAAPAATPLSIVSAMSRNPDGQKIKTARKSGCYCPSWIGQRGSYGVGTYSRMRFSVHTVFGIDRLRSDHPGKTLTLRGSLARSAENAWTT